MFVCFLLCLEAVGLVGKSDHRIIVTRVFAKYISIVRLLQTIVLVCVDHSLLSRIFYLRATGLSQLAHGVHGDLDDYCFLPFYWYS